jgi:FlaA1/EpsC-like NDP-sugar epimerase
LIDARAGDEVAGITDTAMPGGEGSPADMTPLQAGASGRVRGAGHAAARIVAATLLDLRGRHLFVLDAIAVAAAILIALQVRQDGPLTRDDLLRFGPAAALPLVVRPLVNVGFGLYRRLWRHASVPDLWQVVGAVAVGSAIAFGLSIAVRLVGVTPLPLSFWPLELVVSLALIGGSRFSIRAVSDMATWQKVDGTTVALTPALLFGAGREGALTARSAKGEPAAGVVPVGFLDDDRSKHDRTVAGLPVLGDLEDLEEAIRRTGARMLLITLPNPSGLKIRRIMDRALEAGLQVRTVPPVRGLFDGSWNARRSRDIRLEDLLTREQVTHHAPQVAETIRDQVVMVTGAGGSIGSELARQIWSFGPRKLVLIDRAESPLYLIQRELELRRQDGRGSGELSVHLANVASRAVMQRVIANEKPAVIFHAAACKHVPMMEEHPSEGVQVNVGGTMAVLSAAKEAGVPRFVLVSTDKAVEPSSVMGATKRMAEWLVAEAAAETGRDYVAVRFGNVLGSAGSVLPIFQSQLENGEPMTITHPDMTRYFMTILEAGWLILDAAAIGKPGDLFVLDMGEPVRIVDMARDLIRLSGRSESDVTIRFTGLRPGEKLHERLFYETETVIPTNVEKILRVANAAPPADASARAQALLARALGDTDEELRAALFDAVSVPGREQAGTDEAETIAAPSGVPVMEPVSFASRRDGERPDTAAGDPGRSRKADGADPIGLAS